MKFQILYFTYIISYPLYYVNYFMSNLSKKISRVYYQFEFNIAKYFFNKLNVYNQSPNISSKISFKSILSIIDLKINFFSSSEKMTFISSFLHSSINFRFSSFLAGIITKILSISLPLFFHPYFLALFICFIDKFLYLM